MILYLKKVCELLKKSVLVQVKYVPRVKNSQADALAKLATVSREDLDRRIPVEHLPKPLININSEEIFPVITKDQNIGKHRYIGNWILQKYRKYQKISVDILTKISVMEKLTKIL